MVSRFDRLLSEALGDDPFGDVSDEYGGCDCGGDADVVCHCDKCGAAYCEDCLEYAVGVDDGILCIGCWEDSYG